MPTIQVIGYHHPFSICGIMQLPLPTGLSPLSYKYIVQSGHVCAGTFCLLLAYHRFAEESITISLNFSTGFAKKSTGMSRASRFR